MAVGGLIQARDALRVLVLVSAQNKKKQKRHRWEDLIVSVRCCSHSLSLSLPLSEVFLCFCGLLVCSGYG